MKKSVTKHSERCDERRFLFQAMILILAMVLAACGSSDASPTPRNTPLPTAVVWREAQQPITLQNAPSLQLLGRLDVHGSTVVTLQFSADSRYLATASTGDTQIQVWSLVDGRSVFSLNTLPARHLLFSNRSLITIDRDQQIREWRLEGGEQVASFPAQNSTVGPVAQSMNGTRIAVGGRRGRVYLFTADPLAEMGFIDAHPIVAVEQVIFTPDGQRLITVGRGGSLKVWAFAEGNEPLHDFGRFETEPFQLAVSPDGMLLAVAFSDEIRFWRLDDYTPVMSIPVGENEAAGYIGFSPDGALLVSYGAGDAVTLWEVATGRRVVDLPGHRQSVVGAVFSGDLLLTGTRGSGLDLWDLTALDSMTGSEVQINRSQIAPPNVDLYRFAWSPDGKWIVFSDVDGRVYLLGVPD